MKKLLLTLSIVFLFAACNNDSMNDDKNPYPDGVYPYEVSGVSHTYIERSAMRTYNITWTPPADSGFSAINIELFGYADGSKQEFLIYSSVTGEWTSLRPPLEGANIALTKNSFSYNMMSANDEFVIIKCVDKFGNVSKGVKYEFSWN